MWFGAVIENEIVGEALIALKHEELKEMGIASVGHRLTILKSVYETKVKQDIPLDPDHYIPLCMLDPRRRQSFDTNVLNSCGPKPERKCDSGGYRSSDPVHSVT